MMGILQVKLVTVLVLLKLVSASVEIDKVQYYKSLTPQERQEIFNTDDVDHVPSFEIINIDFPRLQKRSLDGVFPLTLPLLNKNINLNLKLAAPLIGPNTPVYNFQTALTGKIMAEKTLPFKDYIFNVYEDEDQQASLVVDIDANGNKYVHSGIIGSHNISLHRAPNHQNPQLQGSVIVNLINLLLNGGRRPIGGPGNTPINSPVQVPDVIYPEILLMIDASLYNKYTGFDSFKNYILNFWTTVNLKYKPLSRPKYKLSIAGIAIAKDRDAFDFINLYSSHTHLNFQGALIRLGAWLYLNKHVIPLQSYDVAIVHTLLSSTSNGWFSTTQTVGLANLRGACTTNLLQGVAKGGIIYDDNNYGSIYTAAHELAHTLGANHDDDTGCVGAKYIMSAVNSVDSHRQKLGWSQCSINGLHDFLRTNPECLFNVPEPYQKKTQTPVTPPPEVDIDINNRIDTDSNNAKNDDASNENERMGKNLPAIPENKRNELVPNTNINYSELDFNHAQDHFQLDNDFIELQFDPQQMPSNKLVHMQIINKKDIYTFLLDKAPRNPRVFTQRDLLGNNGLSIGNNNRGPRIEFSWNNRVVPGNTRIEVGTKPIAELLFPERVQARFNDQLIRNNNGARQTRFF